MIILTRHRYIEYTKFNFLWVSWNQIYTYCKVFTSPTIKRTKMQFLGWLGSVIGKFPFILLEPKVYRVTLVFSSNLKVYCSFASNMRRRWLLKTHFNLLETRDTNITQSVRHEAREVNGCANYFPVHHEWKLEAYIEETRQRSTASR